MQSIPQLMSINFFITLCKSVVQKINSHFLSVTHPFIDFEIIVSQEVVNCCH